MERHIHTEVTTWINNVRKLGEKSAPMSVDFMEEVVKHLPKPVDTRPPLKDEVRIYAIFSPEQTSMLWYAAHEEDCVGEGAPYYVETGSCKPWNGRTMRSLEKRGLLRVEECDAPNVYDVYLTEEGRVHAKDIFKNIDQIELS